MRFFDKSPRSRWLVPVVVGAVLVGGGTAISSVTASAGAGLPDRTAAQLLVDVQQANLTAISGTVVQTANLGLPELPIGGGGTSSEFSSLVSGTHTLRIWYAGPTKARLALLGSLGESDIITNGKDVWTWSSQDNTATHLTLPAKNGAAADSPLGGAEAKNLPKTPQEAANLLLKMVNPSTKVSTDGTAVVAGRAAYELVLQPRDTRSLVSQVRVAIDGERHVPLRIQVFAAGQTEPALEVAFSAVSFARPDDAQFAFNPPPGAKVVEQKPDSTPAPNSAGPKTTEKPGAAGGAEPKIIGTGWTAVAVTPPSSGQTAPAEAEQALGGILNSLPRVSGSWGSGRLLSGSLFSVVVADDGRIAVGAVKPALLYEALGA